MTKEEVTKAIANPHAFIRGQYDAMQFGYIPDDYSDQELSAWSIGYSYGKTEKPFLYLEDLEEILNEKP
jgi:hypothetical protein